MAVVASRIRRRLRALANAHASPRCPTVIRAVQGRLKQADPRVLAHRFGLWMRAEEQMDTRSRPPGCGAGPLGRMRPLRDGRRMRPCASCRALSHQIARPPARQSQRLVLLWLLLLSVPSSTPDAPGFISVANFEEVAEVEGETGSVRAYTHTHIHTHTHTHTPLVHCE